MLRLFQCGWGNSRGPVRVSPATENLELHVQQPMRPPIISERRMWRNYWGLTLAETGWALVQDGWELEATVADTEGHRQAILTVLPSKGSNQIGLHVKQWAHNHCARVFGLTREAMWSRESVSLSLGCGTWLLILKLKFSGPKLVSFILRKVKMKIPGPDWLDKGLRTNLCAFFFFQRDLALCYKRQ